MRVEDLTSFILGETVFVDVITNMIVNEEIVHLMTNLVMKVALNRMTVNTVGFKITLFGKFVGNRILDDIIAEIAILIEDVIAEIGGEAILIVVPIVRNGSIKKGVIPFGVGGEDNLREIVPFLVSRRTKFHVSKTLVYGKRSDVTIGVNDSRSAPGDMRRPFVNGAPMSLHLNRRQKCLASRHGRHLMPNANAFAQVCANDRGKRTKTNGSDAMVIDAVKINTVTSPGNETHLGASNASIGAAINKSTTVMTFTTRSSLIKNLTATSINGVMMSRCGSVEVVIKSEG